MARVVTLGKRKAAEAERRRRAVEELKRVLATYVRAHAGRFLLFGSAARTTMRHDSDVDILTDFPKEGTDEAWAFAENACRELGLSPDIRPRSWCAPIFLHHIERDVQVIG